LMLTARAGQRENLIHPPPVVNTSVLSRSDGRLISCAAGR